MACPRPTPPNNGPPMLQALPSPEIGLPLSEPHISDDLHGSESLVPPCRKLSTTSRECGQVAATRPPVRLTAKVLSRLRDLLRALDERREADVPDPESQIVSPDGARHAADSGSLGAKSPASPETAP